MKNYHIAVAMSVYKNDNPKFLYESIISILSQEEVNVTLFIQIDGMISDELKKILILFNEHYNINLFWNKENKGLATRLNQIIEEVIKENKFDYLARMDADDISHPRRFITQAAFLDKHKDISVVGSDVIEISENGEQLFYKKMHCNHDDIVSNVIQKCPFNHPSVMFNIAVFKENFRYKPSLKNTQDYYLWIDLIFAKKRLANINLPLLWFRVDNNFHQRRGIQKSLNESFSRIYAIKKLKIYSVRNILHIPLLFMLRISPEVIKKIAYKKYR